MSLKNLSTDSSIADEKDSVGGGGVLASGLYPSKVTLAYMTKAASEAVGIVIHAKTSEGRDIRSTQWVTSGKAKGGKNFYEKDGQKHYLPGFLLCQSLALLTVGKELSELDDPEEKVVNLYNFDAKAEVPTKVQVLTELIGKEVLIGLIKQTVDKNVKTEAGYVPSGETRDENEIDKFFRASDRKTTAEIRAQAPEAVFVDTWNEKWAGQVRNKATKTAGTAGAPKAAAPGSNKPKTSLFA